METQKAPFAKEVASILSQIGYKKRTVFVSYARCNPISLRSMWDGGSRTFYSVLRNGEFISPPISGSYFEKQAEDYVPLVGDVLVQSGTFQGKPAIVHLTFYGD